MRKSMKIIWVLTVVSFCFLFASLTFGQELPKPGEVIDKSNYKKYAHLFSEEFLPAFENGFGGLMKPWSIKVSETKSWPMPKAYQVISEKNRGKYSIDNQGLIGGGYNYEGIPFPGLTKDDKDFANKLMWNYRYRYYADERLSNWGIWNRRLGEPITRMRGHNYEISCINRLYVDPKPFYKTPVDLQAATILYNLYPPSQRNFSYLLYTYLDPRKPDETYMYLPQMRRVLRGEGGERSTPVLGSIQSPDDFEGGFMGKTFEFTYKFVGEQKVLGVADSKMTTADAEKSSQIDVPYHKDNWEVRDVYVIDIVPKDAKYPQSKKRVYIDKENFFPYFATAWDRAGKAWKVWASPAIKYPSAQGDILTTMQGMFAVDIQFGMASYYMGDWWLNGQGYKYVDFTPSALTRLGR